MNRIKLPLNVKRIPIFGLGCVAGAAGIARAADYVRAFPDQAAALIAVELCSLTWQRDDLSVANLISSALFGDGAAAVIVAGAELKSGGPQVLASCSSFYPNTEEVMGWDISEKGFRIVLSPSVPEMVFQHLANDVDNFLESNRLTKADIHSWIMHTGGPKVLAATAEALHLPKGRAGCFLGGVAQCWQSLFGVGAGGAGDVCARAASARRELLDPGGHGSGILRGTGIAALVREEQFDEAQNSTMSLSLAAVLPGLAVAMRGGATRTGVTVADPRGHPSTKLAAKASCLMDCWRSRALGVDLTGLPELRLREFDLWTRRARPARDFRGARDSG